MTLSNIYITSENVDRQDTVIFFDERQPPVGSVLQIEDERIWHYPEGFYVRGVDRTKPDRHFANTKAYMVGIAMLEEYDGKDMP